MKHAFKITFPSDFLNMISEISKEITQSRSSGEEVKELISLRESKLQAIYNQVQQEFYSCDTVIKSSTAGQLFDRQLHEFVKNSVDAQATEMMFTFEVNAENQVEIRISDNGKIEIPTKALGKYNWSEVVLLDSAKENNHQLGGCHLGLATTANFLETVGDGQLHLAQRPEGGATLTLTSSTKTCDIDRFSFANYVWEIIRDLGKKSAEFKETNAAGIHKLKAKYAYPETFQSNRDKIMSPISHAANSQTMFALSPIMRKRRSGASASLAQSSPLVGTPSTGSDMFSPLSANGPTPTITSPN